MKKLLSLLIGTFMITSMAIAQDDGIITGEVYDQQGDPVPSASVSVYDSTQSEVITGAPTEGDGSFTVDVDPGKYVIKITFVSFAPYTETVSVGAGETQDLGEITLQATSEELDEVVVRAESSQMEMNFDKRVFNVGQDITSLGGSAINVLNNVPSIATDIDGNISLRGNESVRVLINGKPSSMVSGDVDALRSIPSTMIKEVEIITNPSSKYAAEGSGGIINIILTDDRELGLNGSASVGGGYPEEYEGSINLNYRTENVNWFTNIGADFRSEPESGSSFQRFSGPDTQYMYREQTDAQEAEIDGDFRVGADFYLSDNEILTASSYISLEQETNNEDMTYTDWAYSDWTYNGDNFEGNPMNYISGSPEEITLRDTEEEAHERNFDFNLDYENKIDGDDHKFEADASFDISRENADTDINEIVREGAAAPLQQRAEDNEEEMDFRINADYQRPLGENGKLEAGLRTDTEWMDTGYSAATLVDGVWEEEPAYTQNFLYRENVNAAFLILGGEFGDFSGQVGLRAENTNIKTEIKQTGDVNEQNYIGLFPSVFLNYAFNDQQSVQVSYSRRLRRPWSRSLLPGIDFDDNRSQYTGNPNLTPEYSNSYEAGYLHYWGSGSLLTSFYYRYRTDVIERITEQENGVQFIRPINFARERAWGIEFSADQEIGDIFTLNGSANLFKSDMDGTYESQDVTRIFSSSSDNFQARMRLRWEIFDGLNYQASMRYRGPSSTPQGSREGMTMTDTGISYDVLDERAKITFNVRDVFDAQNFDHTVNTDGNPNTDYFTQRQFSWSTRSFSLNFQYFFGREQERSRGGGGPGGDY
ncbi:outer membrane beta-barrel family protein [Fodinibius salsisoli]|uniref:TonB-dependent receptor n=1 Tax=Fodinibius salsisoli TaxID=2820877 RepID=A0ABT3PKA4_9BACT|nr:outer membrane beta-barrel family protein [Fodinibius salsisoli]MCW9705624.1 TonB-dependent receptor [Fodinibius salsisoli]